MSKLIGIAGLDSEMSRGLPDSRLLYTKNGLDWGVPGRLYPIPKNQLGAGVDTSGSDFYPSMDAMNADVQRLSVEISQFLVSNPNAQVIQLQTSYLDFLARWDQWYASRPNIVVFVPPTSAQTTWMNSASDKFAAFRTEFDNDRDLFVALGGKTTTLPPSTPGPFGPIADAANSFKKTVNTIIGYLPWVALGVAAYYILPTVFSSRKYSKKIKKEF